MNISDIDQAIGEPEKVGAAMYDMIAALYPICRSITGEGFRQTLRGIEQYLPLEIREVATGTPVFDWTVPLEWNIRDAYIATLDGRRVVDFKQSNLHVMSYSVPVKARMRMEDLQKHLHTLPDRPAWIPYRTSYYKENWGFCLSHHDFQRLADAEYEVCIDSSLQPGHLTYGECLLPGQSSEEILISVHACHPSYPIDQCFQRSLRAYVYPSFFINSFVAEDGIALLEVRELPVSISHFLDITCRIPKKALFPAHACPFVIDAAMNFMCASLWCPVNRAFLEVIESGSSIRRFCLVGFGIT